MPDVLYAPKGVSCQAFSCALVQCHLTLDLTLVTFHLLKHELWPLEKWPLILTGPNGAGRTAGDRRQMETHMHVKTDTRVLVHRHWETLMECKASFAGLRSDRKTMDTHTHAGRARLTQETAETCRSCLFPCLLTQQIYKGRKAHTHSLCVIKLFGLCPVN